MQTSPPFRIDHRYPFFRRKDYVVMQTQIGRWHDVFWIRCCWQASLRDAMYQLTVSGGVVSLNPRLMAHNPSGIFPQRHINSTSGAHFNREPNEAIPPSPNPENSTSRRSKPLAEGRAKRHSPNPKPRKASHPGGITAISRGVSEATPPDPMTRGKNRPREGSQPAHPTPH